MAYDLAVGKSNKVNDQPIIIGSIEFETYPLICKLLKKYNIPFFKNLSNQFSDHTFHMSELIVAKKGLYGIMEANELNEDENNFIYKMIAIVSYAIDSELPLHGIAD